jgi:hypothetical protein
LRTTTFGGGHGGRSAEDELLADPEGAAIAGSDRLALGVDLLLVAAMQGAVFFALLRGLCFAAAGAFGAVEALEAGFAGGAGGAVCGEVWAAGADESGGLT